MRNHVAVAPVLRLATAVLLPTVVGCSGAPPALYGDTPQVTTPTGGGGGDDGGAPPAGDCAANPCAKGCVDRGPPDFSREMTGKPSASSDANQKAALVRANHYRTAAGLVALNASDKIEKAATAHATFVATNAQQSCWSQSPHVEQSGPNCKGFTGADVGTRMMAAGYQWSGAGEVMDWDSTPETSVDQWIWSVYHRSPFMDPKLVDTGFGYMMGIGPGGMQATTDVMDFGTPMSGGGKIPSKPWMLPVPGQTKVPTAFQGWTEGPTPPAPGGGDWNNKPSGQVISVHFPNGTWTITDHKLFDNTKNKCTPIDHFTFDHTTDMNLDGFGDVTDWFMYANSELPAPGEIVVQVTGTWGGSMTPQTLTWAFSTGG